MVQCDFVIFIIEMLTKWNYSLKSVRTFRIVNEYVSIAEESEFLISCIVGNRLPWDWRATAHKWFLKKKDVS